MELTGIQGIDNIHINPFSGIGIMCIKYVAKCLARIRTQEMVKNIISIIF